MLLFFPRIPNTIQLLGHESNDIDIAINNMMGEDLANRIKDFATEKGFETGTVAPVKSNPDQSKHLETAKLKLLGLELDLVNLRSEEYAENSRIPTGVVSISRALRALIAS